MRRLADTLCSSLIPLGILVHLCFAPYTKVEESFNIQATHDILSYGISWKNAAVDLRKDYDHLTFTGPIPRTFVGPLALAGVSWPFVWIALALRWNPSRQIFVRAVLGLFNAYCLISFRNRIAKAFGRNAANWYAILQASQFHIMYYASRTLPNFFAFGLTIAARNLLPLAGRNPASRSARSRHAWAISLLTATGIIFRSEVAILLFSHIIYLFFHPHIRLPILSTLKAGISGAVLGLALTVPIDTFFWASPTPLWPELTSFTYNILHSQSQKWGISPWHFYLTSSLPRLLSNPFTILLIFFTISVRILRPPARDILAPNLLYVVIYSFQPHKEWRFIIYVIPPLLAVAAAGASWIWIRRGKTLVYRILAFALVASTLASFAASAGMLLISRLNYPGAEALNRLHETIGDEVDDGTRVVHMDTLSCMTGVTRFLQRREGGWVYDKTEDEERLLDPLFWDGIDYALAERPERVIGAWEPIGSVEGFAGLGVLRPGEDIREGRGTEGWEVIGGPSSRERNVWKTVGELGERFEEAMRKRITKGWWVRVKMEPRIRILRRQNLVTDEVEAPGEDSIQGNVGYRVQDSHEVRL